METHLLMPGIDDLYLDEAFRSLRGHKRLADTALPSPQDIAEEGLEFPLLSQEGYLVRTRSVAIFVAK